MPQKRDNTPGLSYNEALSSISDHILEKRVITVGSFREFIRDTWSKGYSRPELFSLWHIEFICNEVEEVIQEGKGYVAVLPRGHFKSTILGHGFSVWRLLQAPLDSDILYLSFSDQMSNYHTAEMKKAIRRNPLLSDIFKDQTHNAESSFRYLANGKPVKVINGGVFSFKRGTHVSGALIADDILRDPDNPLDANQVTKVEDHFMAESLYIPNQGAATIILGTPMLPDDLFTKLQSDERFFVRVLPALDPTPTRRVLAPEIRNEEWLLTQKKNRPQAFAAEMMLQPYYSTNAYITEAELTSCERDNLKSLDPFVDHPDLLESDYTIAGFDVGKKRHPSHLVVYSSKNGILTQIHQSFLDGWTYTSQVDYLNVVAKNFHVDKGYIDNTRGELEERGLHSSWNFLTFTAKQKHTMAQIFEQYVTGEKIHLIRDARQSTQITSVTADLEAPVTPLGHGDSFWSNALACLAHSETISRDTQNLGNLQDLNENLAAPTTTPLPGPGFPDLSYNKNTDGVPSTCPQCNSRSGWVPERRLCLICFYRG